MSSFTSPYDDPTSCVHLVNESNPITAEMHAFRESIDYRAYTTPLDDPDLARIVRLRLIGFEPGYPRCDVSYCYGILKDGTHVRVQMPEPTMPRNWKPWLIKWARANKVYLAGLGLFAPGVISELR